MVNDVRHGRYRSGRLGRKVMADTFTKREVRKMLVVASRATVRISPILAMRTHALLGSVVKPRSPVAPGSTE